MNEILIKAELFYFDIYLPAIASYFVVQSSASGMSSSPSKPDSREKVNLAKDSTIKDSYISDDKSKAFRIDDCIKMQINDQNHKVYEKVAVGNKKHDASVALGSSLHQANTIFEEFANTFDV